MKNPNLDQARKHIQEATAILFDKIAREDELVTDTGDLSTISSLCAESSASLAYLGEMAGWRGGYGCGDHGQTKAQTKAQAKKRKVRKALGYSIP